jgi:protein O-mannosyl-transferase
MLAILAVAAVLAYANSLRVPFVLDDQITVLENPQIRTFWSTAVFMPERELPVAGRPLVNATLAFNYALDGANPRGYHTVNLLLHMLCGFMLFGLVRRVLVLPSLEATFGDHADSIAFASALIWLLHPLNSEVVNYVTQRTEAMLGLAYLTTLYASVRALERNRGRWQMAAILACLLGMACKESMVTAPVVVMLFDRLFAFSSWRSAFAARRHLYLGLCATWALLAVLLWSGPRIHSAGFSSGVSVWTYLLNQPRMIARYLWLTVWPRSLVVFYGAPAPQTVIDALPYGVAIVMLLAATLTAFRFQPMLAFLGAWFFITLAPTSSIVPIATEVGAERRMYLPLMAIVVFTVAIVTRAAATRTRMTPRHGWIALAILAALLGARTFARNAEYADTLRLAEITVNRWPTGASQHMVGEQLLLRGQKADGVRYLREAIKTAPRAHFTLGMELYTEGRVDESIAQFQEFIRKEPLLLEVPTAHVMLARAYGRRQQWDLAAEQARLAIAKAPRDPSARLVLAEVLFNQEAVGPAIAAYTDYLRFRPNDVAAINRMAVALIAAGRAEQAIAAFRRAVELEPANGVNHRNLATALLDANIVDQAATAARAAIALRPQDPVPYDLLGQALARQGQLPQSLAEFERALEIDPANEEVRQHAAQVRELLRR